MAKPKWTDATSYSRGEEHRVPRTWEMSTRSLRIVVTRRIHLEGWWLFVPQLNVDEQGLSSDSAEDAQVEALNFVRARLQRLLSEVPQ